VGVGGDQARREDAVTRVDRIVHRPIVVGADVKDVVSLDHDHAVAKEAVPGAIEGQDETATDRDPPRRAHGSGPVTW
jgi:hypothetical protein